VADPQQVARRIDDRELAHAPRLVGRRREAGNPAHRQLQGRELRIEPIGIIDAPIAGRVVGIRGQGTLLKKVHDQIAARDDLVLPGCLPTPPRGEAEPLVELSRLLEISRRQYRFRSFLDHRHCQSSTRAALHAVRIEPIAIVQCRKPAALTDQLIEHVCPDERRSESHWVAQYS
jgi:hypothetical protein